jgi:acyl carrier protein
MPTRIDEIKSWLTREKPHASGIDMDTDLIENRVLDSVTFVNFVYYLEELTGKRISLTSPETANSFRTLRSIQDKVLGGARHEG